MPSCPCCKHRFWPVPVPVFVWSRIQPIILVRIQPVSFPAGDFKYIFFQLLSSFKNGGLEKQCLCLMPKGAFQIKYLTGIFKLTNAFGSFWYLIFFLYGSNNCELCVAAVGGCRGSGLGDPRGSNPPPSGTCTFSPQPVLDSVKKSRLVFRANIFYWTNNNYCSTSSTSWGWIVIRWRNCSRISPFWMYLKSPAGKETGWIRTKIIGWILDQTNTGTGTGQKRCLQHGHEGNIWKGLK